MARALLRDDVCIATDVGVVQVVLDDSCPTDAGVLADGPGVDTGPPLDLRLRTRTGYDDDGVPEFAWVTVGSAHSLLWSEREEWDAEAGVTIVKATATLSNDTGLDTVPETAVVVNRDTGQMWRISKAHVEADRIEVVLDRVEASTTEPGVPDEPVYVQGVLTGHGPPPDDLVAGEGTRYVDLDSGMVWELT